MELACGALGSRRGGGGVTNSLHVELYFQYAYSRPTGLEAFVVGVFPDEPKTGETHVDCSLFVVQQMLT